MDDVVNSFGFSPDFVHELVAQVSIEDMAVQSNGQLNHRTRVIRQLTLSYPSPEGEIVITAWLLEPCWRRYDIISIPIQNESAYESKRELLDSLQDAQERVTIAAQELNQTQRCNPLPEVKYRPILRSNRHCVTQTLVVHSANHVGPQVVWNRQLGLSPTNKPFCKIPV